LKQLVPDWRVYSAAGHRTGTNRAAVTVVIFSDYQCDACRNAARRAKAVYEEHPTAVSVVTRHYPLKLASSAATAARAAECAAAQGRFDRFHEALFARITSIGTAPWTEFALEAEVPDTNVFNRCLSDPRSTPAVDADIRAANRLGVFATPTILVNNEQYVGIPWDFERIVRRHVDAARSEE